MTNATFAKLTLLSIIIAFLSIGGWLAITTASFRFYYFLGLFFLASISAFVWLNCED